MSIAVSPEQVEQWVLQSSSPHSDHRQDATIQLKRFLGNDQVVPVLLILLTESTREQVVFYALSELARCKDGLITPSDESKLLKFLLSSKERLSLPFLRNKAALLLACRLFRGRWDSFESDLQALATAHPALFLSTVEISLELLVSTHERLNDSSIAFERSEQVDKTAADESPRDELVDPEAIRRMRTLLKSGLAEVFTNRILLILSQDSSLLSKDLIVLALKAAKSIFLVELAAIPECSVNRLLEYLLVDALRAGRDGAIQLSALQVWNEWIHSSMDNGGVATLSPQSKLEERQLRIVGALLEKLHEYNHLPASGESSADIEVVIKVAKLVCQLGLRILPAWCKNREHYQTSLMELLHTRMNQILDLFFRAFAYDDIDVSEAVIPLATALVKTLERNKSESTGEVGMMQHLPQILNTLYLQLKYPPDYNREENANEVDAEEQLYRAQLCKLFTRLVRFQPSLCLQFLCEATSQWLAPSNSSSAFRSKMMQDIEATLRLVFQYAEGIHPPPGAKTVVQDPTFSQLIVSILSSDVINRFDTSSSNDHQQILLLYYDIAVRYNLIFEHESNMPLLSSILSKLTGELGLQHPIVKVRSRCCFLLLRFISAVCHNVRPHVDAAVVGIQQLLLISSSHPDMLRVDDVMNLFEAMGILVGKSGIDEEKQQQYLRSLLAPHIHAMEEILSLSDVTRDIQRNSEVLSCSVAAISQLSKGFSTQASAGVRDVLIDSMRVAIRVLEALPSSESVRNKIMVLTQRMIICIDIEVLPFCSTLFYHLIAHCTRDDILFVSQLFIQVCTKFKHSAIDSIDAALLPFINKCHALVSKLEIDVNSVLTPHLTTEQLSIRKIVYSVIYTIVTNRATNVFLTDTNIGGLEFILRSMCDGAVHVRDVVVQRTCIKFFRELVKQWGEPTAVAKGTALYQRGSMTFIAQVMLVSVIKSFLDPSFNPLDANQSRCIAELNHVLCGCLQYDLEMTTTSVLNVLPGAIKFRTDSVSISNVQDVDKVFRGLLLTARSDANS